MLEKPANCRLLHTFLTVFLKDFVTSFLNGNWFFLKQDTDEVWTFLVAVCHMQNLKSKATDLAIWWLEGHPIAYPAAYLEFSIQFTMAMYGLVSIGLNYIFKTCQLLIAL